MSDKPRLTTWMHVLDEICRRPDPCVWFDLAGIRIPPGDIQQAVQELQDLGYVERGGVLHLEEATEQTVRPTTAGLSFWKERVEPYRTRPSTAKKLSRHSKARTALAISPRDVFDLWRVGCTYSMETGKRREFDLWDGNLGYKGP